MEVIVVFVLLCLFVNNGHGTPQMNYISRNQTWNEASNDSSCSMIGLNLTGEIEKNLDNTISSIALDTHQTAWIGAYAKRVWITFEGCYYGIFNNNFSSTPLTPHEDPAKSCLKHCNYSEFVLTDGMCVCFKDVKGLSTGCLPENCPGTKYTYCGKGTSRNADRVLFYCMCRFSIESDPRYISNGGDCMTVTYKPQLKLIAMNCSYTNKPVCYDPDNNQVDLSVGSNNWLQSFSKCYNINKQFAGRTTNVTGIRNGTYWVGTFVVTFTSWGRARSENDSCVAVNIDRPSNHLKTVDLPCNTFLPVVCSNTSLSTLMTTGTTILNTNRAVVPDSVTSTVLLSTNTRLNTTSTSGLETTSNGHAATFNSSASPVKYGQLSSLPTYSANKVSSNTQTHSQTATIVGSVVGTLVIILIIVVVLLWRRGVLRKPPSVRSNKNINTLEMRNPSTEDNMGTDDSIHNDVYNHLGEIKTKQNVSGEDLYDHTGAEGETYGHLNSERYEEDSEYDHTSNHTVSDTYEHLNSSYLHDDDNAYDHTCISTAGDTYGRLNRHNHQSDNENNYDHTDDMYSHLHAGTNRDVGDDVYDHTGGSGNMYGHINISKPV